MKIAIDLQDILHDHHGDPTETLAESIRRQVVEHITATAQGDVKRQISEAVSKVLDEELRKAVVEQMPAIVGSLMDHPYTPVGRYGDRGKETTFRAEFLKAITEQMVYKKASHDSDKNAFSKAVDATVSEHLSEFKAAFNKQVDGAFVSEAMAFATAKMRERFGLPK